MLNHSGSVLQVPTILKISFLILVVCFLSILPVSAMTVESYSWGDKIVYDDDTFELNYHGNNYQTWMGVWESKHLMDVGSTHYPYLIVAGSTGWTLTKNGEFLTLPKNEIYSYSFNPYHIGITITATPTQLNSISTYHNVADNNTWYIVIPEQVVNNVKIFNWDNILPVVTNQSDVYLNQSNFEYHKIGDEIRFYYNQEARDFGQASSKITFKFNSWYVVGDSGSVWSGNVTYDGTMQEYTNNNIILQNDTIQTFVSYSLTTDYGSSPTSYRSPFQNSSSGGGALVRVQYIGHSIAGSTFVNASVSQTDQIDDRNVIDETWKLMTFDNGNNSITTSSSVWTDWAMFTSNQNITVSNYDNSGNIRFGSGAHLKYYGYGDLSLIKDWAGESPSSDYNLVSHSGIQIANFTTTGNLTQNIYDSGAGNEIKKIGNNGTFADGTVSVDSQINSSADNSNWTGWYTVQSNITTGTMYDVPAGYQKRYYQVKSVLSTTNVSKTPIITNIRSLIGAAEDEFAAPTNIQTTPSQTWINITWDAVPNADKYSVYELENGFPYVDTDPVIDGIKDAIYDYAHEFLIFSPNPVNQSDHSTIYPVRTSLGAYLLIECVDNDDKLGDDDTIYYFDLDNNGLTTSDYAWKITDNIVKKYHWDGASWKVSGGSSAVGASTGAGTHYPIHELFIPIAELGANWTNGSTVKVLVKREDSSLSPDVVTWYPYGNINNTDTSLWQEMVLNDLESYILLDYTTNLWYNATGLTPFTIYHGAVSAWNGTTESNYTLFDVITEDLPIYTVSGTVSDTDGNPIANAIMYSCNGFVHEITTTNVSGYWVGYNFREDNYTICANKAGYYGNSINIFVDSNLTNQNITLTAVPLSKYHKIGEMLFAIPTILKLVFQKIADVIPIFVVLVFIMLIINVIGVAIHAIRGWR